jgi:hypothetical protein
MAAKPLMLGEVAGLLQGSLAILRAEVAALPPSLMSWHPAPGEWCVKEVIGHLIEAEQRGFAGRIRIILETTDPQLQAWDQNAVARARRDCEREAVDLLHEFGVLRKEGVALARRLGPDQLARGGHHPKVGYLRVSDLLHEWVYHDRNHLKQILGNVQGCVWPHMGNAQKFAGE